MSENILCNLLPGEKAIITRIGEGCPLKRRLSDLGFVEKTPVECTLVSPLGDPKAFLIKNTVIALRKDDSKYIHIKNVANS